MLKESRFFNIQNKTSAKIEIIFRCIVTQCNATHEKLTHVEQALEGKFLQCLLFWSGQASASTPPLLPFHRHTPSPNSRMAEKDLKSHYREK